MSLIKQVQRAEHTAKRIVETFEQLEVLPEAATHVLANIAHTASSGKPLKVMHLNSISAFMSGIETIAKMMPQSQDETKKANTIRVLSAAAVGSDGFVTGAVAPIAQLGARNEQQHNKYSTLVNDYMKTVESGKPDGRSLAQAARLLQQQIDQAVRVSTPKPVGKMATGVSNAA